MYTYTYTCERMCSGVGEEVCVYIYIYEVSHTCTHIHIYSVCMGSRQTYTLRVFVQFAILWCPFLLCVGFGGILFRLWACLSSNRSLG